jgi:hypothetical protein
MEAKSIATALVIDKNEQTQNDIVEELEHSFLHVLSTDNNFSAFDLLEANNPQIFVCNLTTIERSERNTLLLKIFAHYPTVWHSIVIIRLKDTYARSYGVRDELIQASHPPNKSLTQLLYKIMSDTFYRHIWLNKKLLIDLDGQILLRQLLCSQRQDWALLQFQLNYGPRHYGRVGAEYIFSLIDQLAKQAVIEFGTTQDLYDKGDLGFIITFASDYDEVMERLSARFNTAFKDEGFQPLGDRYLELTFDVYDARKHSAQSIEEIAAIMKPESIQKQYERDKKNGLGW